MSKPLKSAYNDIAFLSELPPSFQICRLSRSFLPSVRSSSHAIQRSETKGFPPLPSSYSIPGRWILSLSLPSAFACSSIFSPLNPSDEPKPYVPSASPSAPIHVWSWAPFSFPSLPYSINQARLIRP